MSKIRSSLAIEAIAIAKKIGSYPRPCQPIPAIVTLDSVEYAGCRYNYPDEVSKVERWQNEPNDYVYFPVSMSTDPITIAAAYGLARKSIFNRNKHDVFYRFIEESGQIWLVVSYMTWPIPDRVAELHPFGPSVIMKQISPEMAKAIELVEREKPIGIVTI